MKENIISNVSFFSSFNESTGLFYGSSFILGRDDKYATLHVKF